MKVPVFVSSPTVLSEAQNKSREIILDELDRLELEPRALGRSDFPTELPLREVFVVAKHCSGGVILGYEQIYVSEGLVKRDTKNEKTITKGFSLPTPWNHLEAGILYSMGLPLLVFKDHGISGGIFDLGVTDVFVHSIPHSTMNETERRALSSVFLKWQAKVREHYYQ